MARTLCLSLDLERIVVGAPGAIDAVDFRVGEGGIRQTERCAVRAASQGVSGDRSTGAGGAHINVVTKHQNMGTPGTCVASRQDDLTRQLALYIHVELLNSPLLEILILP